MAQPPLGQDRFVGVVHADGGFTFGDPTNPFVVISATDTTGGTFVDTTSGAQDESNPVLGQFDPTKSAPITPTPPGTVISPTDFSRKSPTGNKRVVSFVTPQPDIADLKAAPTEADFNALLAALRAAGVLKVAAPVVEAPKVEAVKTAPAPAPATPAAPAGAAPVPEAKK